MLVSVVLCTVLPSQAGQVQIAGVTAKSEYDSGGQRFPASKIKDSYVSTQWFEGDPGNGLGAWISVDLGSEVTVTKVVVYAGDWKSGTDWQRANRPKEIEVKYSDDSTEIWHLTDEWKPQVFVPSKPKATSSIRFKLNQVFSGTAFPDTAISEILVFDDKGSAGRLVTSEASTTFPPDEDGSYDPMQIIDGLTDTFWCEGNKGGDGVGEWVKLGFGAPRTVSKISVCTGMCLDLAHMISHRKGNVPTALTLAFSDGTTTKLTLKDTFRPQEFPVSATADSVRVTIDQVRKGTEFNDACLSEISFQ